MPQTTYCYHCRQYHLREDMRQIDTKGGGKKWRCIKSINAAKADIAQRDAFGRQMSKIYKAAAHHEVRILKP